MRKGIKEKAFYGSIPEMTNDKKSHETSGKGKFETIKK